jgi:hypothetical protein
MKNSDISPFKIAVAPEVLIDLRQRLKNTRQSYHVAGTNWDAGTNLDYLQELVAYWGDTYDGADRKRRSIVSLITKPCWTISASTSFTNGAWDHILFRSS